MEFIKKNFLAVCILLSALILSIAIIFNALCNRYYYVKDGIVFDKLTSDLFMSKTISNALKD